MSENWKRSALEPEKIDASRFHRRPEVTPKLVRDVDTQTVDPTYSPPTLEERVDNWMDEGLHLLRTRCRVRLISSCSFLSEMCTLWKKLDCMREELRMCEEEDMLCREIRNGLRDQYEYLHKCGCVDERMRRVVEESHRIMLRWNKCKTEKARLRNQIFVLTSKIKVKKSYFLFQS